MRPGRALLPLALALFSIVLTLGCAAWQEPGEPLGARLGADARYVHTRADRSIYVEVKSAGGRAGDPAGTPRDVVPTLFVHGFASNHDVWDTVEPALRATRRTINVDLPGFGWSSRTDGDYSPTALAEDLTAVLDAVGAPTVDVVAHSWGSSVALAFALSHPDRVRRIVLIGAWIYDDQIPPFFRWARVPVVGEALFSAFYTERPGDRFPAAFDDPSVISQDLVDAITRSFERAGTSRAALAAARGQCFLQLETRYHTVTAPTLLLWGANDRVARVHYGERLQRDLPDARLTVIPGTGHFPMLEAPVATREAITDFLTTERPSP